MIPFSFFVAFFACRSDEPGTGVVTLVISVSVTKSENNEWPSKEVEDIEDADATECTFALVARPVTALYSTVVRKELDLLGVRVEGTAIQVDVEALIALDIVAFVILAAAVEVGMVLCG
jgi:hypothetical protein